MTNELLLPTLCIIWVLSIAHWSLDITRVVVAFFVYSDGSLAYFENVSSPLEAAKTAVYISLTLTGDFFLIYRCYIVWNRKVIFVIVPILCWLGTGVGGYGSVWAVLLAGRGGIFFQGLAPWVTSFFASSLCVNLYCTACIAYRILRTQINSRHRDRSQPQKSRVYSALIIFLESAATYSTSFLVLFIVYELGLEMQYILLDLTSSLIGITFTMILLRLAMQSGAIIIGEDYPSNGRRRHSLSRGVIPMSPNGHYTSTGFPLTAVTVSRFVEVTGRDSGGGDDGFSDREPQSAKSEGAFAL
ncbi:hypothetical protein C8F01DRAFT_483588 [Mycena amicta]|nr:hypothetical protein C8F01DRAFT_483588 [Mycena amicta]